MTVVFNPAFAPETISWRTGNNAGQAITAPLATNSNPNALRNPLTYLIFRGSSWTSANAGLRAADAQTILESPYLSGLKEYGSDGKAKYGGFFVDDRPAPATNDASRDAEIQYALSQNPSWAKPTGLALPSGDYRGSSAYQSSPIFVVVFDNGDGSAANGGGIYESTSPSGEISNYVTNAIRINNGISRDSFTVLFTHELVERISDGNGVGIRMDSQNQFLPEPTNAQIADNEPDQDRYVARLNGSLLVQAYWSIAKQAFVVPDGSQQNIVMQPLWNGHDFLQQFVSLQQGNLYRLGPRGDGKTLLDTNVVAYATDTTGKVYELTAGGQVKVESATGAGWLPITGTNTKVAALISAAGQVYILARNNGGPKHVWRYSGSGTNWTPVTDTNINRHKIVGAGNKICMLQASSNNMQIWQYSGAGTDWTPITDLHTPVMQMAAAGNRVYAWAYSGNNISQVLQYSGSGTTWAAITGTNTAISSIRAANDELYMLANNGDGERVWQFEGTPYDWTMVHDIPLSDRARAWHQGSTPATRAVLREKWPLAFPVEH